MEAKDKAIELVQKFQFEVKDSNSKDGGNLMFLCEAKQCALIAVDEILNESPNGFDNNFEQKRKLYWQDVKQEILKL